MNRTTYTHRRHALCPQAGDRIFSVSSGGLSFAPGNGVVTDVIYNDTTIAFVTEDGSMMTVEHGAQIYWERNE